MAKNGGTFRCPFFSDTVGGNKYYQQHSAIILGGAQLGLRYGITHGRFLPRAALYELLDKARYLGFHNFDLAQAYGCAEERLALWRQFRRDKSLRFGSKLHLPAANNRALKSKLRRRRTQLGSWDYILLHSGPPRRLKALRTLCPRQKIGLSLYYPKSLAELLEQKDSLCQVLQIPYSAADRRFEKYFSQLADQLTSVELQLRSLYLQGLLLLENIDIYVAKYPILAGLTPLLCGLAELEKYYSVPRQDLLLYAGLRHRQRFSSLRLVLGLSCAAELLALHYSLLRINLWTKDLCRQITDGLEQLPQLKTEILVPSHWA